MLRFLGSDPTDHTEWQCDHCKISFEIRMDEQNPYGKKFVRRDPTYCPFCEARTTEEAG